VNERCGGDIKVAYWKLRGGRNEKGERWWRKGIVWGSFTFYCFYF